MIRTQHVDKRKLNKCMYYKKRLSHVGYKNRNYFCMYMYILVYHWILTALKDLVDNILFSIIIIEAYLVKGGKFSNTHLLSGCIREECGTQRSASSVVCLKFTIPIPKMPHTTMHIMIVKMGCKATVLPSLQIKYNT